MSKPTVEVCLSPTLFDQHEAAGKTIVVIDIFRATTTISAALAHGVKEVLPVKEVAELHQYLDKENHICGAENNGQLVEPFEYGNSPYHYMNDEVRGKTLVLRSTNGTRLIELAASKTDTVYTGAFTHLSAMTERLLADQKDCILFCAAWKQRVNLEDSLFAGAVVEALGENFTVADDSALASRMLYTALKSDLFSAIQQASHYNRLAKMGVERDIKFALEFDQFDQVPTLEAGVLKVQSI